MNRVTLGGPRPNFIVRSDTAEVFRVRNLTTQWLDDGVLIETTMRDGYYRRVGDWYIWEGWEDHMVQPRRYDSFSFELYLDEEAKFLLAQQAHFEGMVILDETYEKAELDNGSYKYSVIGCLPYVASP